MLAEPIITITWSPAWIGQPASSVSATATRAMPMTGVSQRNSSSMAFGMSVGVLDELALLLGVLRQEGEHAVERGGDRVESRDQKEEADVEDVLAGEAVALHFGVEEVREEVVAPLDLTLVEDLVEVVVDGVRDHLLVVGRLLATRRASRSRGPGG